jgi:hypothetical protein
LCHILPFCASALYFWVRCTHKRCHGWRGGRSTAQNHDSGHLWMSLDAPDVYLIERAPRCLCYASPLPRSADGANGAMHTLGGHNYATESKAGTSRHQAGVGSYLLRAIAGCKVYSEWRRRCVACIVLRRPRRGGYCARGEAIGQ